jgi:hypothetical protein
LLFFPGLERIVFILLVTGLCHRLFVHPGLFCREEGRIDGRDALSFYGCWQLVFFSP